MKKMYVTLKLEMFTVRVRRLVAKAKVNISVCSLTREVKVKVTTFDVGRAELINAYKPTK